jgi:hypothetical protein
VSLLDVLEQRRRRGNETRGDDKGRDEWRGGAVGQFGVGFPMVGGVL